MMHSRERHINACGSTLDTVKPQVIGYNGCRLGLAAEKHVPQACLPTSTSWGYRIGGGSMAHEEWRDVVGYEGYYQVSSLGRVRSLTRNIFNGKVFFKKAGKMMRITVGKNQYCRVTLTKDAKQVQWYVHRLVAMAFLPNPDNLPEVDHIDANPSNNRLTNLRWVTKHENMNHIMELGHHYDGSSNLRHGVRKVPVIRSDGKVYDSMIAASRALGYKTNTMVWGNLNGRCSECRGYTFQYA